MDELRKVPVHQIHLFPLSFYWVFDGLLLQDYVEAKFEVEKDQSAQEIGLIIGYCKVPIQALNHASNADTSILGKLIVEEVIDANHVYLLNKIL